MDDFDWEFELEDPEWEPFDWEFELVEESNIYPDWELVESELEDWEVIKYPWDEKIWGEIELLEQP